MIIPSITTTDKKQRIAVAGKFLILIFTQLVHQYFESHSEIATQKHDNRCPASGFVSAIFAPKNHKKKLPNLTWSGQPSRE